MSRRLAYLIVTVVLVIVMSLPILAIGLAARGELMVGSSQGSFIRLFMVNADQVEGIGLQRVRKSSSVDGCLQGSVRYFLWEGQGQTLGADYCTCPDAKLSQAAVAGYCTAAR